MDWGSVPDWLSFLANLITVSIAFYAAFIGLRTLRNQLTSSDVSLSIELFKEINRYWDLLSEKGEKYDYLMGQILAHFEIAAGLFNRGVLTEQARLILGDHIIEVFSRLKMSSDGEALIDQCCSSPTTFEELKKFASARMPSALNAIQFQQGRSDQ